MVLQLTVAMNVRFDENVDATYSIEVYFNIFILVAIAHPIQGSAVHVVLFVACTNLSILNSGTRVMFSEFTFGEDDVFVKMASSPSSPPGFLPGVVIVSKKTSVVNSVD